MNRIRFFSISCLAVFVAPWLHAQSFSETVLKTEKHAPVCGDMKAFHERSTVANLPGCVEVENRACPEGASKCINFYPYVLAKSKIELEPAPASISITPIDDLGYYKARFWLTSLIISRSTSFKEKLILDRSNGADTFDEIWEWREHLKALGQLQKEINEALESAKAGKLPNSQGFIDTFPAYNAWFETWGPQLESKVKSKFLETIKVLDETSRKKNYIGDVSEARRALNIIRVLTDNGTADDYQILYEDRDLTIQTRTIGPLRTQLTSFLADIEPKAEAQKHQKQEREQNKWGPYLAVIKGDRLQYLNSYREGWTVFGPERSIIQKPQDFVQARAMYTCYVDEKTLTWSVRGGHFEGDRQIGGDYVATGVGRECPSSAFK